MKEELISIVITTYNRSNKLEDAIKSAINQTYKNIEIIVVDDNSEKQNEREETKKIVRKYNNINLVLNTTNLGGALSRNEGIKVSKGDLISFLDDDDMYLPERLEIMYKEYLKHKEENVGLIYCNCSRINDNKEIIGSYENNYNGLPLYQQMLGCIAGTSMWLAKKEVLENVSMFEDTPSKQDSILLLKIIANGYNVFSVNQNLVLYYEHNGNGISGVKLSNINGLLNYRNWCRKYYAGLESKRMINNVECNFSKQLITLYIINDKKKEAKEELRNVIKHKPFSLISLKSIYKIVCSKHYLKNIKKESLK